MKRHYAVQSEVRFAIQSSGHPEASFFAFIPFALRLAVRVTHLAPVKRVMPHALEESLLAADHTLDHLLESFLLLNVMIHATSPRQVLPFALADQFATAAPAPRIWAADLDAGP